MLRTIWKVGWFVLAFALLFTSDAFAYGPVIHAELSLQVLGGLSMLTLPVIRGLLESHGEEFVYGSMAADVIMGKSLARAEKHPHNWEVGFAVLEQSEGEAQSAFAWGYLSHLAADVVAHNYYVPSKLVESYSALSAGHAYWELRLDERASAASWEAVNRLSRNKFGEQEELLSKTVDGTIFPFGANLTIFHGWLFLQRLERWKSLLQALARKSSFVLKKEESSELLQLSHSAVLSLLNEGRESWVVKADPTGWRNLKVARQVKRELRKVHRKVPPPALGTWVKRIQASFLQSLCEPETLRLPSLPFAVEVPAERRG